MRFSLFSIARSFLFISVFAIAIVTPSTLFPFIVGKYVFFRIVVALALIFFLSGLIREDGASVYIERFRAVFRNPLAIALSIFTFVFLLASFFGVHPQFSFWSNFERGEGGLQILTLYVFFALLLLLFREEEDWRKIFRFCLVTALLMILYGVFASSGIQGFIGPAWSDSGFRFHGSIGNPAYVAAYLIFILGFLLYIFATRKYRSWFSISSITCFICGLVFLSFFFLAATRGAFVGLGAALLMLLMYLGYSVKQWRKWLFTFGGLFLIFVVLMVNFRNTDFVKSIPGSRVFDLSFSAETFQKRTAMWRVATWGALERPLFGWGPENFPYVFDRHYDVSDYDPSGDFGVWFDRAHSIFFDTLATTGFLGLLSFLAIFLAFYFQFFRARRGVRGSLLVEGLVFAFPIAYLVQGLVLFDVLVIYIPLYLFLAFAMFQFEKWKEQKKLSVAK